MVDLRDPSMHPLEFYTLRALCDISLGGEITVGYGTSYFGSDGLACLGDACTPAAKLKELHAGVRNLLSVPKSSV